MPCRESLQSITLSATSIYFILLFILFYFIILPNILQLYKYGLILRTVGWEPQQLVPINGAPIQVQFLNSSTILREHGWHMQSAHN